MPQNQCVLVVGRSSTKKRKGDSVNGTRQKFANLASLLDDLGDHPIYEPAHLNGFTAFGQALGAQIIHQRVCKLLEKYDKVIILIWQSDGLSRLCRLDKGHNIRKDYNYWLRHKLVTIKTINKVYDNRNIPAAETQFNDAFSYSLRLSENATNKTSRDLTLEFDQLVKDENQQTCEIIRQISDNIRVNEGQLVLKAGVPGFRMEDVNGAVRDTKHGEYAVDLPPNPDSSTIKRAITHIVDQIIRYPEPTDEWVSICPLICCEADNPDRLHKLLVTLIHCKYLENKLAMIKESLRTHNTPSAMQYFRAKVMEYIPAAADKLLQLFGGGNGAAGGGGNGAAGGGGDDTDSSDSEDNDLIRQMNQLSNPNQLSSKRPRTN